MNGQQERRLRDVEWNPAPYAEGVKPWRPEVQEFNGGGGGVPLPFLYAGAAASSKPANNVAQFNCGWVEVVTAGDDALIGTPSADDDGTLLDDTVTTETVALAEGENFVYAHFHRAATVADSTLVLAKAATWAAIPTTTNDDYYYLLALVKLTTTAGKGKQALVQQYRAGVIMWNAKPKSLTYCDGGTLRTYEIPAYEAPPPDDGP